jgi:hypothetical protein
MISCCFLIFQSAYNSAPKKSQNPKWEPLKKAPRYFEWISHHAAAKRRQRLTFSVPKGRSVSAPAGRQAPVSADFAPKGVKHLAVGDERSEEPTESIKKNPSPEGASHARAPAPDSLGAGIRDRCS